LIAPSVPLLFCKCLLINQYTINVYKWYAKNSILYQQSGDIYHWNIYYIYVFNVSEEKITDEDLTESVTYEAHDDSNDEKASVVWFSMLMI
jgi:hypothetical protein